MIFATKIRMKPGCGNSWQLTEIEAVYLEGLNKPGFYTKEAIYDYLKMYPGTIKVKLKPYPDLIPSVSINREKYVRSEPNEFGDDNLLCLRRV